MLLLILASLLVPWVILVAAIDLARLRQPIDDITAIALLITAVGGAVTLIAKPIRGAVARAQAAREAERERREALEQRWTDAAEAIEATARETEHLSRDLYHHIRLNAADVDAVFAHFDVVGERQRALARAMSELTGDEVQQVRVPAHYRQYREQRRAEVAQMLAEYRRGHPGLSPGDDDRRRDA